MQYLEFCIKKQPYAVPIGSVREINRMSAISSVPGAASYVAGVMNLRGKVIPVVDLRCRFGYESADATKETCIIVVESGDRQGGLIVDSVTGVSDFGASQVEPAPSLGNSRESRFVTGIGRGENRVVVLVDPAALIADDEDLPQLGETA